LISPGRGVELNTHFVCLITGVLALVVATSGCGDDVFAVDVVAQEPLECSSVPLVTGAVQSVAIEVVRATGGHLEQVDGLGTCVGFDRTRDVHALLDAFSDDGVIISGVPADDWTILRFVGYRGDACQRGTENVCGLTCPPVRAGDLPEKGVVANFVCGGVGETRRAYLGCLGVETLDDENRLRICPE